MTHLFICAREPNNRHVFITDFDLERLEDFIKNAASRRSSRDGKHLEKLEQELFKADVVPPASIPADADSEKGKISVLAPIGTAVIGYEVIR